jgi:ElaB/YqjD/DUF883 family membrane-anchored ribosome-binding protein
MNPTEAKFRDDLESIATELDIGVRSGKYTWADVQERLKSKSSALATETDRYVHEYAWTSVAVAAVLGVLIGALIPRD